MNKGKQVGAERAVETFFAVLDPILSLHLERFQGHTLAANLHDSNDNCFYI